jgi:hypothetical protein
MPHAHSVRQASKFRCQLLTCSTLAVALLCETRGLMEDLSEPKARPAVRTQTSTGTPVGRVQPGLQAQWSARSSVEPMAITSEAGPILADGRDRGSNAQMDETTLRGRRRRTVRRSISLLPYPKRYVRSEFLAHIPSTGEESAESTKTP